MNPLRFTLAVAAALVAFPVASMTDGRTAQDRPFVSGGVTQSEIADIRTKQPFFNLSLLTAAKGSGAYLAGVRVRIMDGKGQSVLETEMDGPYLLVDLQPGKYQLEATNEGETQKRTLTLSEGRSHRMVIYFKSEAEVSPDLKQ
jgi:hypothetical protein